MQHFKSVRIAEELGADIVKIDCPESRDIMEKIVNSIKTPVIIAGGCQTNNIKELLLTINDSIKVGLRGVAIGRNVFQYKNQQFISSLIYNLVDSRVSIEDSLKKLEDYEKNAG